MEVTLQVGFVFVLAEKVKASLQPLKLGALLAPQKQKSTRNCKALPTPPGSQVRAGTTRKQDEGGRGNGDCQEVGRRQEGAWAPGHGQPSLSHPALYDSPRCNSPAQRGAQHK